MILTPREKQLLRKHLSNGYVRLQDFNEFFATQTTVQEKVQRFLNLGILTESEHFKLVINKSKIEDLL